MEEIEVGSKVTGIYKTGKYIGEVTEIKPMHYLVKVKAVAKHPQQGDLHAPKEVDVPLFHERRALSYHEQTNIPKNMVRLYEGEIPEYKESLKLAVHNAVQALQNEDNLWSKKSLANFEVLKKDYRF
ncbi:Kinase-associated lipoprotein B precursor [Bacillus sp. THAF10]|uniref:kinase-associated lipoprotein B n=1 Tax=Bacillus sp. THAF10 TaxID=2587848 RepID=UPI001268245C|nr:kinase-associated lipoprotein B [Bacillus sp. THAF10]QFT90395.1 Kinase-associated lipoprotein B precursor [Bacillus sp. THAF10]